MGRAHTNNPINTNINSVNSSIKYIRTSNILNNNLQQQLQQGEPNMSSSQSVYLNHTRISNTTISTRQRQTHAKNSLKGKVLFQCSLYLIALFLSWMPYLSLILQIKASREVLEFNYGIWTFAMFLLPLQGFLNAVVYFKRRISRQK